MSNNIKKFVAVALLSVIGLAACSKDVQAKPSDYDDSLITFKTDSKDEIYHNLVSIIEDAYRDGSLPSAVLDRVLYTYSVSVFGRYNKVAKPTNLGEGYNSFFKNFFIKRFFMNHVVILSDDILCIFNGFIF